jgi:hypothetical protein
MQRFETGNELRSVFLLPEGEGKDEGAVQIDTLTSILSRRRLCRNSSRLGK